MSMYKTDGVDLEVGDSFSKFAGRVCASTYESSRYVRVRDMSRGHFRGLRGWDLIDLPPGCVQTGAADGIGTAVIAIDAAFAHTKAPQYLLAMCAGDLTRKGALPLIFFNLLDTSNLGEEGSIRNRTFRKMMAALGETVIDSRMVLMGGETAELGVCVGSENPAAVTTFNWAGFALGVCHEDKMILGDGLEPGHVLLALRDGFRSNGWSSIRKAFKLKFGDSWFLDPEAIEYLKQAVVPPTLYDNLLATANGWYARDFESLIRVKLVGHVTGGSIESKVGEDLLFPLGLSAELDNLWEPPEIMRQIGEWRGSTDEDFYQTWNGGQGVIVAVDKRDERHFSSMAETFGVEVKRAGVVFRDGGTPTLTVHSKFKGGKITYTPKKSAA